MRKKTLRGRVQGEKRRKEKAEGLGKKEGSARREEIK